MLHQWLATGGLQVAIADHLDQKKLESSPQTASVFPLLYQPISVWPLKPNPAASIQPHVLSCSSQFREIALTLPWQPFRLVHS